MKYYRLLVGLLSLAAVSCSIEEITGPEKENAPKRTDILYSAAITEQPGDIETKTFADNKLRILWNEDDRVTIFDKKTLNEQFCFDGEDGDNAGGFYLVSSPGGYVSYNPLDRAYSVYPYQASTKIDYEGVITFTLPEEQFYAENSFGRGANTMVAVTDNNQLLFKNVGGFLSFKLYGEGISVSSITLKGNNGELLAGKCTIDMSSGLPVTVMDSGKATEAITLTCNPPVALNASSNDYIEFWMVVPQTTFSNGITFTVNTPDGDVYEKSSTTSFTLFRNKKMQVPAMKLDYKEPAGTVAEPVDIGLSVKWASWNVGASKIDDYGGLYGAGDGTGTLLSTNPADYYFNNGESICGTEYDLAHNQWGGLWRMPTREELDELYHSCTWSDATVNGVKGVYATGPNGVSIFLPYSGNRQGTNVYERGSHGHYWSGDTYNKVHSYGYYDIDLVDGEVEQNEGCSNWIGQSIRPVYDDRTDPEAVDLGLPSGILWSSMNVGATSPSGIGGRYAWGEIETKPYYYWSNYKWCSGSSSSLTKYINGKTTLEPDDDVAHVLWGEDWRIPTPDELSELASTCSWTAESLDGVSGYRVTGPNGNSIFIPVNGQSDDYGLTWDSYVYLWANEASNSSDQYAYRLSYKSQGSVIAGNHKHDGLCIRPVYGKLATNLSSNGTANCYIVSAAGSYMFNANVKGNSTESVGTPVKAEVLWESFGTSAQPNVGDIIKNVSLSDGYVLFSTPATLVDGNALVAVKDASNNVLWSWHIWICSDYDAESSLQVYKNNAGAMMDRNLGALSATPGDVTALGLMYQWGRKDPFMGASQISYSYYSNQSQAESSVDWPQSVQSDSSKGTYDYANSNPMTYITQNTSNYDWLYSDSSNRWMPSEKTINDPCPVGYRVPDGGSSGIWETAGYTSTWNSTTKTMSLKILEDGGVAYYPACGFLTREDGKLNYAGANGLVWSSTRNGNMAYYIDFSLGTTSVYSYNAYRADARPVRCCLE